MHAWSVHDVHFMIDFQSNIVHTQIIIVYILRPRIRSEKPMAATCPKSKLHSPDWSSNKKVCKPSLSSHLTGSRKWVYRNMVLFLFSGGYVCLWKAICVWNMMQFVWNITVYFFCWFNLEFYNFGVMLQFYFIYLFCMFWHCSK